MYEYVVALLDGVDLERYAFLPALIVAFIIVLSIAIAFRALLTVFNSFFR